ncbi:MAG: quinolinate synthase NadA [Polyangiales bacterium]|nr:quinolinate synthase NadA [Myxococcales bacterium]
MFPSLRIGAKSIRAEGQFAEAQAAFLAPDPAEVARIDALLKRTNTGVVAHFYMDAELQGVLASLRHPHVHIADSLQMAERGVAMAKADARALVVLGVDFMSESARATLDAAGFDHVPVYRADARSIGCSLAAAAETPGYAAYLERAARTPHSIHVIYVNTSLRTKAEAEARLPTITCTSSNVVRTVLEAAATIPDVHVWFGPDTYMGENLAALLRTLTELGDDAVRAVHPAHTAASVRAFLPRFHHYDQGTCVVHHMFGADVAKRVAHEYGDALLTAHLEVPGEMFRLALNAQREGRGVVGSTSNILEFIGAKTAERVTDKRAGPLRIVLGTESGMVTSIVRRVQRELRGSDAEVEIVFPVAAEAVTTTADPRLPVVPGPASGEGCSTEGGCATCPYMKMNSLDALTHVLTLLERGDDAALVPFLATRPAERIGGVPLADLATLPIVRMRAFGADQAFPREFIEAAGR